jgi:outer membrane protein
LPYARRSASDRLALRRRPGARLRYAIAALALFAVAGTAAAVDYKIGFVNTERLFREATPAKRAQAKIEKEFATRVAEVLKLA